MSSEEQPAGADWKSAPNRGWTKVLLSSPVSHRVPEPLGKMRKYDKRWRRKSV